MSPKLVECQVIYLTLTCVILRDKQRQTSSAWNVSSTFEGAEAQRVDSVKLLVLGSLGSVGSVGSVGSIDVLYSASLGVSHLIVLCRPGVERSAAGALRPCSGHTFGPDPPDRAVS